MKHLSKNTGFTIIELLVVIGLIAVLAAAAIALINPVAQMQKAIDAQRKSDLAQIQRALDLYYYDNQQYPSVLAFGSSWTPYVQKIPNDPKTPKTYGYKTTGQAYYLYASLDRGTTDPQACNSGAVCANASGVSCGGICNYGVTSSNVTP
jgi:prepilin-type N-terminal cleavage/methylation domain-containing protein